MSFSNGYGLVMFKVVQKLKKSFKYSIEKIINLKGNTKNQKKNRY